MFPRTVGREDVAKHNIAKMVWQRWPGGEAAYEINEEQAGVVKQVFQCVGRDHLSIGEVTRRLTKSDAKTATGKD
ncbi:MAG: hypothetical protein AAGJ40_24300 [Planctomycetota bacterium]